jgi:hypothetical protein
MNRALILCLAFTFFVPAILPAQEYKCMQPFNIQVSTRVHYYHDNQIIRTLKFPKSQTIQFQEEEWKSSLEVREQTDHETEALYTFELTKGAAKQAGVSVVFSLNDWSTDNYVIMPAALYDGNRFDVLPYPYNPLFKRKDYDINKPITITDVPRLNKYKGESKAEFTTGDLSTPAIGIFFPSKKKGIWILTEQGSGFGNHGLTIQENDSRTKAEFSIVSPAVREKGYRITAVQAKSDDKSVDWNRGDQVTIRFKAYTFNAESPGDLNDFFLKIRKSIYHQVRIDQLPFSKAFELIENKYNSENWVDTPGYYAVGDRSAWCMDWQLGWTGGCVATLPLSLNGKPYSRKRSFENYDLVITRSQSGSGLFYTCSNGKEWVSDCSLAPHPDSLTLLRKNADALYYIYKYCMIEQSVNRGWVMPRQWQQPLEKLADKFVSLWDQYGQFGQFLNIETGRIVVGGSNSASSAIGGLALAYQFEKKSDYLRVAREAARYYFNKFIKQGVSCGGPGEVLQNPDSESTFAMLESLVVLYEATREKEWLEYAEMTAALFSTWVVPYDYIFPDSSVFGRLGMKTTGSVWANTQNKHSAPGICTFSGDCLFKLYRATGNEYYLELIKDIAHNIMQYVSRDDRQIANQKPGWVNERVNLSDWEGKDRVGNIFYGSTWPDASILLTVTDIPGIYIEPVKKKITVFDHVQAEYSGDNKLMVTNPTKFDASVRVFIDPDPSRILNPGEIAFCDEIFIKAGQSQEYLINGNALTIEPKKEVGPVDHLIVR